MVVDLRSNTVAETHVARGVANQPFVASIEKDVGLGLIFDHPQLGPSLRRIYHEVTGQDLVDAGQLRAQAGIFFPASAAGTPLGTITANCQQHRCIQFFLPVDDRRFIDATNLVVDLSTGQVLWVDQALTGQTQQTQ